MATAKMPACRIHRVSTLVANAYLVVGERTIVVDTLLPGAAPRILARLQALGIRPAKVALILLTHGHLDHSGSAAELRERLDAPIALHPDDADILRQGRNPPLVPHGPTARVLRPFFQHKQMPPFEPDVLLHDQMLLDGFGVQGRVITTPGHTAGSVSVQIGENDMLVGDLLVGGALGGLIAPRRPGLPYFYDDREQLLASVERVLAEPGETWHLGHGGPLSAERVRSAQW